MRLATKADGSPDGELIVVASDGTRHLSAAPRWPNLLSALARWEAAEPALRMLEARLAAGEGLRLDLSDLRAPLPRTWQWLDGSAFATHAELMRVAFGTSSIWSKTPLMYQGMSDYFYGPTDSVPFRSDADGIDFEGEFGVITDFVPMGIRDSQAIRHIRLVVQINDWSLRSLALAELKTGFGWIHAKPACSVAPFAVTPEELSEGWRDGRVCLELGIDWNRQRFGSATGGEMAFSFGELIAHAAATRSLASGTIIGSGTVSNADYARVGSSCIAERRAIETISHGHAVTEYMKFGDRVRMAARSTGGHMPFGVIDQQVVSAQ